MSRGKINFPSKVVIPIPPALEQAIKDDSARKKIPVAILLRGILEDHYSGLGKEAHPLQTLIIPERK